MLQTIRTPPVTRVDTCDLGISGGANRKSSPTLSQILSFEGENYPRSGSSWNGEYPEDHLIA